MTDQTSSQSTSEPVDANFETGGPSLPKFQPLPPAENDLPERPEIIDDEPSPFISDRIKSGHLDKSSAPRDIWIWVAVAVGLLTLAVFGLARRSSETPADVQIVEPQAE